jgi:hypothetical protein
LVKSFEQILGLPPMNQLDLAAQPMFEAFTDKPNIRPSFNPSPATLTGPSTWGSQTATSGTPPRGRSVDRTDHCRGSCAAGAKGLCYVADGTAGRDHILDQEHGVASGVAPFGESTGAVGLRLLAHEQGRYARQATEHGGQWAAPKLEATE